MTATGVNSGLEKFEGRIEELIQGFQIENMGRSWRKLDTGRVEELAEQAFG